MNLAQLLGRSLIACVLTELVIVSALMASGLRLPWQAWVFALSWGVGAGVAFAEALALCEHLEQEARPVYPRRVADLRRRREALRW